MGQDGGWMHLCPQCLGVEPQQGRKEQDCILYGELYKAYATLYFFITTSNVTSHHRGHKHKCSWRPLVSVITTPYYELSTTPHKPSVHRQTDKTDLQAKNHQNSLPDKSPTRPPIFTPYKCHCVIPLLSRAITQHL